MRRRNGGHSFALSALLTLALLVLAPKVAHAEAIDGTTRSTARQLAYEGVQAYEAGNYDVAAERLERAHQLFKAPSVALWSGKALEKQRKLVEASERYLEATRLPIDDTSEAKVQNDAKAEAKAAYDQLAPRIPRLMIEVHGATSSEVKLHIGGTSVPSAILSTPIPVDPGRVEVVAEHQGHTVRANVALDEGSKAKVVVRFDGNSSSAEVTTLSAADDRKAQGSARPSVPADPGPKHPGPNLVGPIVVLSAGAVVTIAGIVLLATANECDYYGYCFEDSGKMTAGAVLTPIGVATMIGGGVWLGLKVSHHKKHGGAPTAVLAPIPVRGGAGIGVVGTF